MTSKFTLPCFIRKNTLELRKKLEELGYKILNSGNTTLDAYNFDGKGNHKHIDEGTAIITSYERYYGVVYNVDDVVKDGRLDCGTNEQLFLALAALRNDSDYMQWFTDGIEWHICPLDKANADIPYNYFKRLHKATSVELIEHFKEK